MPGVRFVPVDPVANPKKGFLSSQMWWFMHCQWVWWRVGPAGYEVGSSGSHGSSGLDGEPKEQFVVLNCVGSCTASPYCGGSDLPALRFVPVDPVDPVDPVVNPKKNLFVCRRGGSRTAMGNWGGSDLPGVRFVPVDPVDPVDPVVSPKNMFFLPTLPWSIFFWRGHGRNSSTLNIQTPDQPPRMTVMIFSLK